MSAGQTFSRFRRLLSRPVQGVGEFEPGDINRGYYNDLRVEVRRHGGPREAHEALERLIAERRRANPITIAQLGLGSLQQSPADRGWLDVAAHAAHWVANDLDREGLLAFDFAMPHTFAMPVPWYSSMAQGEAASLLVRAASVFAEHSYLDAAIRAGRALVDPRLGLINLTAHGPVLQEYPTTPPADVLNGWIFSLWGLYDLSLATSREDAGYDAAAAFDEGARTLAARLHLYETGFSWSRYDLYPHAIVHVASPFYHGLHVAQLRAMARLRPDLPAFAAFADRWKRSAGSPISRSAAVSRKVMFRILSPRRAIS